jgi:ABC-type Na+ efflux pump permease subunit
MKGWLLTVSIFLSFGMTLAIQEYNFILGYYAGAVLIAIHFLVIAVWFTRKGAR